MHRLPSDGHKRRLPYAATTTLAIGTVLAGVALLVQYRSRKAQKANPPSGKFMEVNGVRLHYTDQGIGEPLVLFHGNGSMVQDFAASGLVSKASERYRVIAFDRPGFGYSERPRGTLWTPTAQAGLFRIALGKLGISEAIVLGHSWGASVAVALALEHPRIVRALVLMSGYYYPTARLDVALLSAPAIPIVGDLLRYTLAPVLGRLIWPGIARKLFKPAPIAPSFSNFPIDLALRPGPLRASAEETALMIPDAIGFDDRYKELKMPVVILAGADDKIVTTARQSQRIHNEVLQSSFHSVKGVGHMIQHSAPEVVLKAIDEAASALTVPTGQQLNSAA